MKRLNEFYGFNALSTMPQNIETSEKDLKDVKNLNWKKIKVLDPDEQSLGSNNIFTMNFDLDSLNHILPGIVFKIEQDGRTGLSQPHIQLHKDLQGKGLATKLYRAVLEEFGHLVSKQSKRLSDKEIKGLYKKLGKDSKIDFMESNGTLLLLHKENPEYDFIKNTFQVIS